MIPRRYERIKQVLAQRQPDLTVLMEDVHKPHNLSAIMRTCDAVGIFAVHAVNRYSETPTYSQVAQGSEKWVKLHSYPEIKTAIKHLQQQQYRVYAAHLSEIAIDYREVDYTLPTAILLGTEKWGVTDEAADLVDGHIIIPMQGMVQSLNVSVANAVVLFEAQRQRLQAGFYDQVRLTPEIYQQTAFEWGYPEIAAMYYRQGKTYPQLGEQGEILPS
ncbi:tRNA (guanosine(18)-2'-O)-methyltransferase TrmH [Pleurocapsa sp. CCALA 161]|uniref:tRNA (guanosine(18)-2'-O)-methyltransferase TrmH n=1 Tax=Pleurocapsa sp. CCALA 161 TaxID=2107688 RepID=UPI000D06B1FB|nr:tRNA (guanosine(18)-2'-O)-methyltransferase TrmH [Pleurocapsa sp. CCALA 161]PSB12676.1 tRNA (guanosine(18)-2'-O)-methyltransferase TrmH [Pleurocapsa sp. CCALA 161]